MRNCWIQDDRTATPSTLSTLTRQLLSLQAPHIVRELREAFEENETELRFRAQEMRKLTTGHSPAQLKVPFLFDHFQVYAVYNVHDGSFGKLVITAMGEEDVDRPSFSITVFLTA